MPRMNRNQKARHLLRNLHQAIDEALADSSSVLEAMGELEDAGFRPAFSVDVAFPEEAELPSVEMVTLDEGLVLTAPDESFLRTLGIAAPML